MKYIVLLLTAVVSISLMGCSYKHRVSTLGVGSWDEFVEYQFPKDEVDLSLHGYITSQDTRDWLDEYYDNHMWVDEYNEYRVVRRTYEINHDKKKIERKW